MVELLAIEKRQLLLERKGLLTVEDFEAAWDRCWDVMVSERGWPHATDERRPWRVAMVATKSEMRAAFLDRPTGYSLLASAFEVAARRFSLDLRAADLTDLILGAIRAGYMSDDTVEEKAGERMVAA